MTVDPPAGSMEPPSHPVGADVEEQPWTSFELRPLARVATRDDLLGRGARWAVDLFPTRCLVRFVAINGRDRILIMAGQAFSALIPLLIVLSSLGPSEDGVSRRLIDRFNLTGAAADAVHTLFSRPPGAEGGMTAVGLVILFFAILAFARTLQRTYEDAWGLRSLGFRGTLNGLSGLFLLIAQLVVLGLAVALLHHLPAAGVATFVFRVVAASVLWWELQYLLLSRRVARRVLIPGAVVAGIAQALVTFYSAIYMPHLVGNDAGKYGVIGVTFALLTWLIVVSAAIVVVAVVSAEVGRAALAADTEEEPQDGANDRDDDRREQGRPEVRHREVVGEQGGDPDQRSVHDQSEQAEGEHGHRQ
jgi:membrane protein